MIKKEEKRWLGKDKMRKRAKAKGRTEELLIRE